MFNRHFALAVLLAGLGICGLSTAQTDNKAEVKPDKPTSLNQASTPCLSKDLVLLQADELRQFRDSVRLKLVGGCLAEYQASAAKAGAAKAASLVLDGVEMTTMSAAAMTSAPDSIELAFSLVRSSEDDDSRKSWDALLSKQHLGYPMKLPVALSIGGGTAVVADREAKLVFTTVQGGAKLVSSVVVVGVAALAVGFALLLKGNALRDSWGGPYSLGKSQMAFWGLIVFLTFLGVWITTGTMERIPPQTLMLLGISGATGLAAVLIGNAKDSPSEAVAKLDVEKAALLAKGAAIAPQESQRLTAINKDLIAINSYMLRKHATLGDFFRDICDDGTGPSFHRMQVLAWTLLLGAVFVWSVTEVISMPEFPQTLLLLMGISNGTYLGFKFPEKV